MQKLNFATERKNIIMKKTSKIFALAMTLVMIVSAAMIFTSCGGPETFEEFVNSNEELKTQIDGIAQSDDNGAMTVEVKENKIIYTYKYSQTYDSAAVEQMKTYFEEYMDSIGSQFESIAKTCEEQSEITGITVDVIYLNGDDAELFKATYSAK